MPDTDHPLTDEERVQLDTFAAAGYDIVLSDRIYSDRGEPTRLVTVNIGESVEEYLMHADGSLVDAPADPSQL